MSKAHRNRRSKSRTLFFLILLSWSSLLLVRRAQPRREHLAVGNGKRAIEASSAEVYYTGIYWNDYEVVKRYMNRLATGEEHVTWQDHLLRLRKGKPFRKALILSCGNGWVEAELFSKGVIESAVGVDVNADLLALARQRTVRSNLPFRYYLLDSNQVTTFPEKGYDVVINHAALHHAAFIDRQVRAVYRVLVENTGILVNFDYTGPHRNQYDEIEWDAMIKLNEKSLPKFRKERLRYPHLPTMLKLDPSEAIHSELIIPTLNRYFMPIWNRSINGGIAYELLTHNKNLAKFRGFDGSNLDAELKFHFHNIIAADEEHAHRRPNSSLFWYSVMQPKFNLSEGLLLKWSEEERVREEKAMNNEGIYYPVSSVSKRYQQNAPRLFGG